MGLLPYEHAKTTQRHERNSEKQVIAARGGRAAREKTEWKKEVHLSKKQKKEEGQFWQQVFLQKKAGRKIFQKKQFFTKKNGGRILFFSPFFCIFLQKVCVFFK